MKITIIAFGTQGDAQPAVALGKALQTNGHQVRILASANFKSWIEKHGLEAATATVDIQAMMSSEGGQEWSEKGSNPIQQIRIMSRLVNGFGFDMTLDAWKACQGAEAIISSFTSDVYAFSIAQKLGAKHLSMPLQPSLIPTYDGRVMINAPLPNRLSIFNYWAGKLIVQPTVWEWYGRITNRFRQEVLGYPPQSRQENQALFYKLLTLHGFSQHVVPRPADWPPHFHITGFWFWDEDEGWQPPIALQRFLEAGEPPVYIGFGSMTGRNAQATTELVVNAVQQTGKRAILLSGWAGLGNGRLPSTIFQLETAPHTWLFPHVSAVVHHGGAGTTAAGLRAGVPTVIVPHLGDQPFWGERVAALGVGPKPIPRPKLTARVLAQAIQSATTIPTIKQKAAELATKIREERGVETAVSLIEQYLRQ